MSYVTSADFVALINAFSAFSHKSSVPTYLSVGFVDINTLKSLKSNNLNISNDNSSAVLISDFY